MKLYTTIGGVDGCGNCGTIRPEPAGKEKRHVLFVGH